MHLNTRSKTKSSTKASTSSSLPPPHPTTKNSLPSKPIPNLAPIPKLPIPPPPLPNPRPLPLPRAMNDQELNNRGNFLPNNNEDDKAVGDYMVPTMKGFRSPIRIPDIQANHWEVKPALINIVSNNPFTGQQNPSAHLASFLELCATFKLHGISMEIVYLKLFPFSLVGKAKEWLYSHEPDTFTTWEELANAFLLQFFPPAMTKKFKQQILSFQQDEEDSFYDTYERFKELLRACPHHNLNKWDLLQSFYDGLTYTGKSQLDQASGGAFMELKADEAFKVIEKISKNSHLWGGERLSRRSNPTRTSKEEMREEKAPSKSLHDYDSLAKKVDSLCSSFSSFKSNMVPKHVVKVCSVCESVKHDEMNCPHNPPMDCFDQYENVDYVGGFSQGRSRQGQGFNQRNYPNQGYPPQGNYPNYQGQGNYQNQGFFQGNQGNYQGQGSSNFPNQGNFQGQNNNQGNFQAQNNYQGNFGNNQQQGNFQGNQGQGNFQNQNQGFPPQGNQSGNPPNSSQGSGQKNNKQGSGQKQGQGTTYHHPNSSQRQGASPQEEPSLTSIMGFLQNMNINNQNLSHEFQEMKAHQRMLETQMAQNSNSYAMPNSRLPSKPDVNSTETINAITLKSGRVLEGPKGIQEDIPPIDKDTQVEKERVVAPKRAPNVSRKEKDKENVPNPYMPPVPYPQRLSKQKRDTHF